MYNEYALVKKSTLGGTADAIRAKTGSNDLIDPAEFGSRIRGISGGGSTLEGGFTVNFHDTEGNLIEVHSALVGNAVSPPASKPHVLWLDDSDDIISFPFTSDTEKSYDFKVSAEVVYLINPSGTDYDSTFTLPDGTPLSVKQNVSSSFIYDKPGARLRIGADKSTVDNNYLMFADAIPCSAYKFCKIRWLYVYSNQQYFAAITALGMDDTLDGAGYQAETYQNTWVPETSLKKLTIDYYRTITGNNSWTEETALNDPNDKAWIWSTLNIEDIESFYLSFNTWGHFHVGEIFLY